MDIHLHKSLYRKVSKDAVIAEYTEASRKPSDYERAKWGSRASMFNRFRLGLSIIDWQSMRRWLDIGCGVGLFFSVVEALDRRFDELVGVDITADILAYASSRAYISRVSFFAADLEAMPGKSGGFDLVTLIGVLQQCGVPPERALAAAIEQLRPGGQLFLTTKHLGWEAFLDGSILPEASHSWFDYGELVEILEYLGLMIVHSGGFLSREGRCVPLEQSHTLYILGVTAS